MAFPVLVMAAALAAATSVHLPVSTNDPGAQSAIDRGLFLYYAYNGAASTTAFTEAASRDPRLAMAYWGEALAAGPNLNTPLTAQQFEIAQRAVTRALLLPTSGNDRAFVELMARRYAGSFADWPADNAAYRKAIASFAQSSGDENARLLAAEALMEHGGLAWHDGSPVSDETRTALALDTAVLRNDPSNPMANHLCIHLYDLAPDRSPALACARRLDAAAFPPQAEHLAHMPAHYWIETGNYAAALASSERAYTGQDQEYTKHDVAVGYSAAMMLGNYAAAQRWSQRMEIAYDSGFDALTALRFGRYAEAYSAPASAFGNPSVRGLAALHLGRASEARAIAAEIVRSGATSGYFAPIFLARVAELDGKPSDAQHWIAQAAADQHSRFEGELIPLLPADEALGFLELRRGDDAAAIAAFSQTLALYPNDPRALYGLAAALTTGGQSAQAARARADFDREWEGADTSLDGADLP